MTALATIMGALPLVIATGAGAESRRPIGVVIFTGVAFAVVVTLVVVPTFYLLLARKTGSPGRVASVAGWRFQEGDAVEGPDSWKAATRPLTVRRSNAQKQKGAGKKKAGGGQGPMADNGVILRLVDVTEDSEVTLTTPKGVVRFKLADIPYGKIVEKLNGAIDLERTAATQALTQTRTEDDFPAIAVAADGTAYVAQISFTLGIDRDERSRQWSKAPASFEFLAKPPGGDQLWVRTIKNGQTGEPIAVTAGHGDLYKTALAIAGDGTAWVIWSENAAWQDRAASANFEIWARSLSGGTLSGQWYTTRAPGCAASAFAFALSTFSCSSSSIITRAPLSSTTSRSAAKYKGTIGICSR